MIKKIINKFASGTENLWGGSKSRVQRIMYVWFWCIEFDP